MKKTREVETGKYSFKIQSTNLKIVMNVPKVELNYVEESVK